VKHSSGQNRILSELQVKNYRKAENYTQTSLRGAKSSYAVRVLFEVQTVVFKSRWEVGES
jgi:hypothetical protein